MDGLMWMHPMRIFTVSRVRQGEKIRFEKSVKWKKNKDICLSFVFSRTNKTCLPCRIISVFIHVEMPKAITVLSRWTLKTLHGRLITKRAPHEYLMTAHPPTLSWLIPKFWPGNLPKTFILTSCPLAKHFNRAILYICSQEFSYSAKELGQHNLYFSSMCLKTLLWTVTCDFSHHKDFFSSYLQH